MLVALHREEPEEKKKITPVVARDLFPVQSYRSVRLNAIVEDLFFIFHWLNSLLIFSPFSFRQPPRDFCQWTRRPQSKKEKEHGQKEYRSSAVRRNNRSKRV